MVLFPVFEMAIPIQREKACSDCQGRGKGNWAGIGSESQWGCILGG